MKNRRVTLALILMAFMMAPGMAQALSVQYDFLTTASIALGDGTFASVNNSTLSFVVDWTTVDESGAITTAAGSIVSIEASIPLNATGIDTALLNDDTGSSLAPYFSTLGFNTTLVSVADAIMLTYGAASPMDNQISAYDPFSLNPIFGHSFVSGGAVGYPSYEVELYRDYGFLVMSDGTGGIYAFNEYLSNSYTYFDQVSTFEFGDESANISYDLAQLIGVTPLSEPVPEPATVVLLGLGLTTLLASRARQSRSGAVR